MVMKMQSVYLPVVLSDRLEVPSQDDVLSEKNCGQQVRSYGIGCEHAAGPNILEQSMPTLCTNDLDILILRQLAWLQSDAAEE
jgi:hypothetical protein